MRTPHTRNTPISFGLAVLLLLVPGLVGCGGPASDEVSSVEAPPQSKSTPLAFTDVTAEAGLDGFEHKTGAFGERWFPEAMGAGCGFLDYDGDGWQDIVLVAGGTWSRSDEEPPPALRLYRNNGDGTFAEVTDEAGLASLRAYGFGVVAADYDNDGDQDLYFTTLRQNYLLRNEGDRTFTDVTGQAGLAEHAEWSTSAAFFDADRDGHLDLYVGSYVDWSPEKDIVCTVDGEVRSYCTPLLYEGIPSRFYRSNGDGTFTEATAEAGFAGAPGKALGVSLLDFNKDDWPDLVVASDTHRDLLYENTGDGTFTEKGMVSGIAYDENGSARAGMGIDVGVVDATGQETMFVGNFSKEMIAAFRHAGNGLFVDRAAVSRIGQPSLLTLTFGLFLFDVDLDRDLDLFAANGHVQPEIEETNDRITYAEPPHLFLNRGDGRFDDAAPEIGGVLTQPIVARGAAYADYDQDGDLDILTTENSGSAHLWRNELMDRDADRRYLQVTTEGRESNRDAIGTEVVAVVGAERMHRRVRTGSSFLAQLEKAVTFGLGSADQVDSLYVRWPSGQTDVFTDVEADQTLHVREGDHLSEKPPL